ncbi:MAG TPA: hypothetical protein VKA46_39845 [Gemmataceae bacterium]|nr:hypothetical protein [Gemmataceae bacterium]
MPITFVLDEHFRGLLWPAIQHHNAAGVNPVDAVRVGDPPDLPRGTLDPDLLIWAEREGRVVVTDDRRTMPTHLADHLQAGRHSPGVLIVRKNYPLKQIVFHLALVAHAEDPDTLRDNFDFIPY